MSYQRKYKLIPDPIYDSVYIQERLMNLIDNPYFQRLRFLKQLAFSFLVYPSTTHTRLEHSLGVFHLANLTINKLRLEIDSRIVIPSSYNNKDKKVINKAIVNLTNKLTEKRYSHYLFEFLISALYHDIGHSVFGHVINVFNKRNSDYEKLMDDKKYVKELLTDPNKPLIKLIEDFSDKLQKDTNCESININNIIKMITEGRNIEHDLHFLGELIHSSIDLDRLDYLNRDCYYSGIINAKIPYNYIISNIKIVPYIVLKDEQKEVHFYLCFDDSAKYSIEFLLISRYFMYNQIYHHYKEKIAENMFIKALEINLKTNKLNFEYKHLFEKNDEEILQIFKNFDGSNDIIKRIYNRELYFPIKTKDISEIDSNIKPKLVEIDPNDYRFIKKWEQNLAETIGLDEKDVLIDIPSSTYYETRVLLWNKREEKIINFEDSTQFSNIRLNPIEYVLCAVSDKKKVKEAEQELFNTLD